MGLCTYRTYYKRSLVNLGETFDEEMGMFTFLYLSHVVGWA